MIDVVPKGQNEVSPTLEEDNKSCSHPCFKNTVSKLEVNEHDVLILKFDPDITQEELNGLMNIMHGEFPDNKVLAMTNIMEIMCESPGDAINLLEGMIAHIRVTDAVKKPSIII